MTQREAYEAEEHGRLSARAAFSDATKGRERPGEPDPYRTDYQRDRDRIIHCKAFRRLSHKTQVFLAPEGDHYRTRLTHTLEVAQIARSIAQSLRLNEDLTEAIALGSRPGTHAVRPYRRGRSDRLLRARSGSDTPRLRMSTGTTCSRLRVVEVLEYEGRGLNLTCGGARRDPASHREGAARDPGRAGRRDSRQDRVCEPRHR